MSITATRTINVVVNSTQARAQLAALNAQLGGVSNTVTRIGQAANNNAIGGIASSSNRAAAGARQLQGGLGGVLNSLNLINPAMGGMVTRLSGISSGLTGGIASFGRFAASMGGAATMGVAFAAALPIAAIAIFAKSIFDATAQVQTYKASLTTVLGDTASAGLAFDKLAAFAAKTPFTLDQAVQGFVKLRALGLTPSERAMSSYGNTAAAMGKGLNDMVEAVADATTGEFERLKEFGIKTKKEGDNVSFTMAGVTTTVGNNAKEIENYLMKIGETKFAGGMENQAKTISGAMSSLTDNIMLMFAELGEGGFGDSMVNALNGISNLIQNNVAPALKIMMTYVTSLGSAAYSIAEPFINLFSAIFGGASKSGGMFDWLGVILLGVGETAKLMGAVIGGVLNTVFETVKWVAEKVSSLFMWAFGDAEQASSKSSRSMIDKAYGVLAAMGALTSAIPKLFKSAFTSAGSMFSILGERIERFFAGDFTGAFDGLGSALAGAWTPFLNEQKKAFAEVNKAYSTTNKPTGKKKDDTALEDIGGRAATGNASAGAAGAASGAGKGSSSDSVARTVYGTNANPDKAGLEIMKGIARDLGMVTGSGYRDPNHPESKKNPNSAHIAGRGLDFGEKYDQTNPELWNKFLTKLEQAGFKLDRSKLASINSKADHNDHSHLQTMGRTVGGKTDGQSIEAQAAEDADKREQAGQEYLETLNEQNSALEKTARQMAIISAEQAFAEKVARSVTADEKSKIQSLVEEGLQLKGLKNLKDQMAAQEVTLAASRQFNAEALLYGEEEANRLAEERNFIKSLGNSLEKDGADITDKRIKDELERLSIQQKQNAALAEELRLANARRQRGKQLIEDASKRADPKAFYGRQKDDDLQAIKEGRTSELGRIDAELKRALEQVIGNVEETNSLEMKAARDKALVEAGAKEATIQASQDFYNNVVSAGQELRDSLSSAVSELFGKKAGAAFGAMQSLVDSFKSGAFSKDSFGTADLTNSSSPVARLLGGFKTLSSSIKGLSGLTKTLGAAGQGAEIGSMVAPIGKLISKKFSTTGSQVGGAIGGAAFGPIGAIAGSVLGGIVGGLMKKAKTGSQGFKFEGGNLVAGAVTGNNAGMKKAATASGNAVISGIYGIAEKLGADINSAFSGTLASIGLRDGKYRVDPTGNGATKTKKGAIDFGKDGEGAAVMYVIRDALSKGILSGLEDFSQRIIRNASDATFDAMVGLAQSYEAAISDMAAMKDPIRAGVDEITKSLDKMLEMMKSAGATSAEIANIEQYKSQKLTAYFKDQLSSLNDYRDSLFGDSTGETKLSQFMRKQEEFNKLKADIEAGKTVDQSAFISVAQRLQELNTELYGTATAESQKNRADNLAVTDSLIANINKTYKDATAEAITQQTDAITTGIAVTNELLTQILSNATLANAAPVAPAASGLGSKDGRILYNERLV